MRKWSALFVDYENVAGVFSPAHIENLMQWFEDGGFDAAGRKRKLLTKRIYCNAEAMRHEDQVGTFSPGGHRGHGRVDAEFACLVAGSGNDAARFGKTDRDRLAAKCGIIALLDRCVERIHVDVHDASRRGNGTAVCAGHLLQPGGEPSEALGERSEQRGGEFRAGFDEREKRCAIDRQQRAVRLGADACQPRRLLCHVAPQP